MRYACYYGILIACLLFTIIIYCELFRIVRKESKMIEEEERDEKSREDRANLSDNEETQTTQTTVTRSETVQVAPSKMDTKKRQKKMFDQMKLYPWALIIGQGPGAIRRLYELMFNTDSPYFLVVTHAICSGLFGFITAVIYGTKTWQIYRYKCKSCLPSKITNKPSINKEVKTVEMDADELNVNGNEQNGNISPKSNDDDEEMGQTQAIN